MKKQDGYRFTKQEIILRFFAFYEKYSTYSGRLAKFLNEYMDDKRNMTPVEVQSKKQLFERTLDITFRKVFSQTIPPKLSITVLEATLVGVAKNIDSLEQATPSDVQAKFQTLLTHEEFSDEKLVEGLSGKPRVLGRFKAAIQSFS